MKLTSLLILLLMLNGCMTINVSLTGDHNKVTVQTDKNVAIPTEASLVP